MDLDLVLDEGGGAFYGPKISVQARDAIGRTWQMSTIQVDFQAAAALRPPVRRRRQRAPPADHDPPGAVRVDRAVLRRAASSTTPAPSRRGWRRCRCGCSACATTTTRTPLRIADRLRAEGFRADVVGRRRAARRPHPQGQAREAARTCSWSATTTSTPAPSASTPRGSERPSGTCPSTTSSTACGAEVDVRDRRDRRSTASTGCGRGGGRRTWPTTRPASPTPAHRGRLGVHAASSAVGAARRGDRHRVAGRAVLRHPQPLPVRHRAPAGDAVPGGGASSRTSTDDEHAELWATVRDAVAAVTARLRPRRRERRRQPRRGRRRRRARPPPRPRAARGGAADSNFMTAVAETRVLPEALPVTWRKLARRLARRT